MIDLDYGINNIDCMIYAEEPKMAPYILDMRKTISNILNIDIALVSIKATTFEGLGDIGNKKAIASDATILLEKR
jgi:2-C-methyl-D-erythritol 2,4-cyclodiphosphate synthase